MVVVSSGNKEVGHFIQDKVGLFPSQIRRVVRLLVFELLDFWLCTITTIVCVACPFQIGHTLILVILLYCCVGP